ncbi:ABC transporter ATP-binding protein [uncultured Jannaschia sp.]|uniref:dipeptide ABC transporter ATP-binding protein n=1 Tax=uncultured Jannaschia sp. TaxID=293347 RepID=UPI00263A2083|nr:ABC transporter ATP-binding protein [uncultured Jannaschia sp.]
MNTPILEVQDLLVRAHLDEGPRTLIDNVSLTLERGEILGLVGESGSGKSLLCRSVLKLMPAPSLRIDGGVVRLGDRDLTQASEREMQQVRGGSIGMIFQNPTSHLDPLMRVGDQIAEGVGYHRNVAPRAARMAAVDILRQVGFPDPERQRYGYPHEFSGGMRQRAMIGVALACEPEILIADEPTTALDVTIQAQILRLLMETRDRRGLSIILISHDLGVVAQCCDRIAVMRDGRIVEMQEKRALLSAPRHPYTRDLIASHPSMTNVADALASSAEEAPLLEVKDLHVRFPTGAGFLSGLPQHFDAVRGVSLRVMPSETLGIVGESGSGKSTLARAILGLTPMASGQVRFDGIEITPAHHAQLRRETAMVFQDPLNALNPRMTVGETLSEVLRIQGGHRDIPGRVRELLDLVALGPEFLDRKPRSLSGGQCQRVGIARALAVDPKLVIADECVAALDVTIQAQIVELFRELRARIGLTLVFIAHDLAIVRNLCQRVVVMRAGEIVEEGEAAQVLDRPRHPYTAALLAAIPDIDPDIPFGRSAVEPTEETAT